MAPKTLSKSKPKNATPLQNAFTGQPTAPTASALASALGPSFVLWKQLVTQLKDELKLDGEDWHSSGLKYGWALRLQLKKRNIVYLGPRDGSFMAAFLLGDKAVLAARKSKLPAALLDTLAHTKRYGEGTPVRIEVTRPEDLESVKIVAKIKVEN